MTNNEPGELISTSGPRPQERTISHEKVYGCRSSCDLFGIGRYDLVDQVQDIITVGEFYAMAGGGQIIFT